MAGIMHKIEETFGGQKKDERKAEQGGVHKAGDQQGVVLKPELHGQSGEHKEKEKEGFMGKIKDKIHGGEGQGGEEKKKKKEKKKKEHGHEGGHSSSSSDSD